MFIRNACVIVLLVVCGNSVAQETEPTKDGAESTKLRALLDRTVDIFQVSPTRDSAIAMKPKSVLRWTNEERDSHSAGLVVLWIDCGQPAAALASYTWAGSLCYEFDLLSREPVVAKQQASTIWQPKAGLKFQPLPNAPAIETTAPARLRQMKALSEQFGATMLGWRSDKSDRAELRRLPRELYRYQPESADVIDGAVFAFVQGTDPEALLLIEAVNLKSRSEWQYAFVRQTSGELEGRHNNQVVWSAEMHPLRNDPTSSGISLRGSDLKTELAK